MDRALKAARASGSLNLSNRSLSDVPSEVYRSLDAVQADEKWWEAVELQKLILGHNNIESLNEELRNLSSLTVLNVCHNKLSELPAAIGELPALKLLDVSFNSIVKIPEEIGSATSLVKFDCTSNRLKELPSALGRCLDLSDLKVIISCCDLHYTSTCKNGLVLDLAALTDFVGLFPSFISNSGKLVIPSHKHDGLRDMFVTYQLTINAKILLFIYFKHNVSSKVSYYTLPQASNNSIASLPDELANCSKLTKLDVEGNKLTMISKNLIASWTMLTELNASKNLLNGLPENIGSLSRLIRLNIHQNKISSIPPSIMDCCSLAELYMGNNSVSTLPVEIGALSHLGTLDLHSNQLKEYPVEACKLHLLVLDLSNNSLTGLPAEMGKMTTLRKLLLTGNPIRTLRSSLVSGPTPALLKYLRSRLPENEDLEASSTRKEDVITMAARMSITSKELSLEGQGLSTVPSEVWESCELMKLDLSKNSIQELPVELSSCTSLQTLILSRNKIKDWPGAILKSLPNLVCLKLDNNPLKQIPSDGFQAVSMLQVLDLSANIGSLPEHPTFSSLPLLQELYLRRMRLPEVPSSILDLKHLRILDLSLNSIQLVPEGLKNLVSLTELDLSDNNISMLPPELSLLEPSLQVLKLDGNPLRSIRRAILDKGTKAVLKYLKDKMTE